MTKLLTVEELQSEIKAIQAEIERNQNRIYEYKEKMVSNRSMKSLYQKNVNKIYANISKLNNQVEQFQYQISVGGRKLKTSIAVTKDLISAGFKKGEYIASHSIRGWGEWKGEFTVKNEPKYLFIDWLGKSDERFNEFYNYLINKYGEDVSKDQFKNITIMK